MIAALATVLMVLGFPAGTGPAADPAAYLDSVAARLGDPGVWVDPSVSQLSAAETARLDAAAKATGLQMRIAVIPAAAISTGGLYGGLAWEGEEIADQLYDRVGVEGVYAVLVSASSQSQGRGFHAVQRASHGPTYHVSDGVDDAVDCCAPDYESMLSRFIDRASQVDRPWYVDAAPWAGGAAGLTGLWWGGTALGARRRRRRDEADHLAVQRPLLDEEVVALSARVSTLAADADPALTREVLDLVEKARHRLDKARGDSDCAAVATLLGSARYKLACIDAVRAGQPVPEPTPPCFFDPRHGPSTRERSWAPAGGTSRTVDICAGCFARLEADQQPEIRMIRDRPWWSIGEDISSYIDGYWSDWMFPDPDARRARDDLRSRWDSDRPSARLGRAGSGLGSWISSRGSSGSYSSDPSDSYDSDSSDSGWGGSSRRRSFSSRTRSSGGGSSRRSSRRSGGSRGF